MVSAKDDGNRLIDVSYLSLDHNIRAKCLDGYLFFRGLFMLGTRFACDLSSSPPTLSQETKNKTFLVGT